MPMLYVTQNGGNFVEKAIKPENIVYIISKVITVAKSNLNYYFSDGHAIDGMSSVYDSSKIEQLISILDWNSINGEYWGGEENLNIKRKKQAEFLVGSDIPFEFVNGFGCYDEDAKIKLVSFGIEEQKIKINKNAYFPKRN